jgi:GNAT superfamily N-acetyltransferase
VIEGDRIEIRRAAPGKQDVPALTDVLVDVVEGGASIGFMHPFSPARAEAFWIGILESAARGERVVLVAEEPDSGEVVGTVQVIPAAPEDQPHRGDIAKMLVHRRARRRGVGEALMEAAEAVALELGLSLLVLDTASPDAERLYTRRGWTRLGVIPGFALWPDGRIVDTTFFYKRLPTAH